MYLHRLLQPLGVKEIREFSKIKIIQITDDSRKVKKGSLFIAIKGEIYDGHDFILKAIESGAAAVIGDKAIKANVFKNIPYIKVDNSRKFLGILVSKFYDNPSEKLKVIGITGTDGKTTTANLVYWILNKAGVKVGLISTIGAKIGSGSYDTGLHVTNPGPVELQSFLSKMVTGGCKYAVLEVTSHGLDQERVAGIDFEVGVLTNITHEHLDYHKTYENYLKAKAKLFNSSKVAILNKDDKSFNLVKSLIDKKVKIISYDQKTLKGAVKEVVSKKFPEDYNRMNAAAAIRTVKLLGVSDEIIIDSIKSFPGVVGRMQEVKNKKGIKILIDFAHTPNALENVLTILKNQTKGSLIAVFGCAGERDIEKRLMMGKIGTRLADVSIFTAEDPRRENVNEIIQGMVKGAKKVKRKSGHKYFKIPERGEAISFAINKIAKTGDIVAICGKGHEKSMCYGNTEYPWSDLKAVEYALAGKIFKIER